jgi:hypothetical protein
MDNFYVCFIYNVDLNKKVLLTDNKKLFIFNIYTSELMYLIPQLVYLSTRLLVNFFSP